jgi:hypothetical protein
MTGPTLLDIFLGLLPLVLLIGSTYAFFRMITRRLDQQTIALERIAAALEKRP